MSDVRETICDLEKRVRKLEDKDMGEHASLTPICPFCGDHTYLARISLDSNRIDMEEPEIRLAVKCFSCLAVGPLEMEKSKAISAWIVKHNQE